MAETMTITLTINGRAREIEAPANDTLLETLREHGYFEVKSGCEKGDCGACAILVDGVALDSCLTLTWTVAGRSITTVAGLSETGTKHPLIETFETAGAVQVDVILLPVLRRVRHGDGIRLDRDPALALDIHRVEDLVAELAILDPPTGLDQTVGQGRLPVIDVGDDAEISDVFHGVAESEVSQSRGMGPVGSGSDGAANHRDSGGPGSGRVITDERRLAARIRRG